MTVCIIVVLVPSPQPVQAWNPFKSAVKLVKKAGSVVGGVVGAPFGGFLDSATSPTIRNAEASAHRIVADFDERSRERIKQMDSVLKTNIKDLNASLEQRIAQADKAVKENIEKFDKVMKENVDRVSEVLAGSVADVDQMLSQRIDDLDRVTETRIGNLDVVATKATLTLEASLMRVVGIACVVVFAAFAAWRIYQEIVAAGGRSAGFRAIVMHSWKPLAVQLPVAIVALFVLYAVTMWFPGNAAQRSREFLATYRVALDNHIKVFDLTRARYMAAQLQAIDPTDPDTRALAIKVDLMRDVLTRPTLLKSVGGLNDVIQRLQLASHYKADDPDVLTLQGYVSWQVGAERQDEYDAACLCARALEVASAQGAFALQPLARNYLEAFLQDPKSPAGTTTPGIPVYTIAQLQALRNASPANAGREDSFGPLAHIIVYNELVRRLDKTVSAAYITMIEEHAKFKLINDPFAKLKKEEQDSAAMKTTKDAIAAARAARARAAKEVVVAWDNFKEKLQADAWLIGTSAPLASFMLNDAVYSRAKWFQINDGQAVDIADPSLAKGVLASTAPPRVELSKLYTTTLSAESQALVNYEEAKRFEEFFKDAYDFETAVIDFKIHDPKLDQTGYKEKAIKAAIAAAKLGLYVNDESYAASLLKEIEGGPGTRKIGDDVVKQYKEKEEKATTEEINKRLNARRLKLL